MEHGAAGWPPVRIAIMVEGETERVFFRYLHEFLRERLKDSMPKLAPSIYDGRLPTKETLKRRVELLLSDSKQPADAVIALTDVYTGTQDFKDSVRQNTRCESNSDE